MGKRNDVALLIVVVSRPDPHGQDGQYSQAFKFALSWSLRSMAWSLYESGACTRFCTQPFKHVLKSEQILVRACVRAALQIFLFVVACFQHFHPSLRPPPPRHSRSVQRRLSSAAKPAGERQKTSEITTKQHHHRRITTETRAEDGRRATVGLR